MNAIQRAAVRIAFGGRSVTERGIAARTIERTLRDEGCSRLLAKRLASKAMQALVNVGLITEEKQHDD